MKENLKAKIKESMSSVLPITVIVFLLGITIVPVPVGTITLFLAGAVMLIVGMGFFALGADVAMMPIGQGIGSHFGKPGKPIAAILAVGFIMGVIITVAEPDLQVLAHQVPAIPDSVLIWTIALGVGLFLTVAVLRTVFHLNLAHLLLIFYAIVFALAFYVSKDFIPMAFDSGGVTTGPITVPFIMAFGAGLAAMREDDSQDNSFGLVALCSIGPILSVLVLGLLYKPSSADYTTITITEVITTKDVAAQFVHSLPIYVEEVGKAFGPILLFFLAFQAISRRYNKRQMVKILVGLLYTFIGLVLFLTGANVGFMPVGYYIGSEMAKTSFNWALIPLGMIIGYFIVAAEPAIHVLNKQVEEVTQGSISQSAMQLSLSIGVAMSLAFGMIRVLTGISIMWFLIPGYVISIVLSFFVPKIFTGIAFDSGGVASGPMTATFVLPFAIGAAEAFGGNIMTDAFGIVAMVAMTPLITIQVLGFVYQMRMHSSALRAEADAVFSQEDTIIEYEPGEYGEEGETIEQ